jgi:replicative DNA helicase
MSEMLNQKLELQILWVLINKLDQAEVIFPKMTEAHLSNPIYRDIFKEAKSYWEKYKKVVGTDIHLVMDDKVRKAKDVSLSNILAELANPEQKINADFVRDQVDDHIHKIQLKKAALSLVTSLQQPDADPKALAAELSAKLARDLQDSTEDDSRSVWSDASLDAVFSMKEAPHVLSGIPFIDGREELRWRLGELSGHLAGSGIGKSTLLCNASASTGLMMDLTGEDQQYKILYVNMEMRVGLPESRILGAYHNLVLRAGAHTFTDISVDGFNKKQMRTKTVDISNDLRSNEAEIRAFAKRCLNRIDILHWPSGSRSVHDLQLFMDRKLKKEGIAYRLVLTDSPKLFKWSATDNSNLAFSNIYGTLNGIAQEYNAHVATVHQASAEAVSNGRVGATDAEFYKAWPHFLSVGLTYSQTDAERKLGQSRVNHVKSRDYALYPNIILNQSALSAGRFCHSYCDLPAIDAEEGQE